MNRLLFGDNLKWLRDAKIFPDASVDLVYLNQLINFDLTNQVFDYCVDSEL
jgi:hypothetical protein